MISFTVRLTFRSEDREDILEVLHQLGTLSRLEPGCANYVPHFVESDPNTIVIYEQYRNEAAVEQHRASAHFAKYAIGGLYQKMLDRSVETLIAIS